MQLCRRHRRMATDIEVIYSHSSVAIYDQLASEFSRKVLSKYHKKRTVSVNINPESAIETATEIETEE